MKINDDQEQQPTLPQSETVRATQEHDEFELSLETMNSQAESVAMSIRDSVMPFGTRVRRRGGGGSNSLPVLRTEPYVSYVARYKRSTGNVYTITVQGLAKVLVSANATTTFRPLIRAFKIKKITIRGSAGAVGETGSVGLRYLGTNTNETNHMDETMKIDENAMVSKPPPRFSIAAFWHDIVSEELTTELASIQYFGTGNFYVDVHLDVLIDTNRYVNYSLSGGSGLVTGGVYRGNLATGLVPVGVSAAE
jgi:hypothetical protein